MISSLMSVNSSISHPRLTRGSYTSYFTLQISNTIYIYYTISWYCHDYATFWSVNLHVNLRGNVQRRGYSVNLCSCLAPCSKRSSSHLTLGVLESGIGSFLIPYQRTSTVSAECPNVPIVWVNSVDRLIRADTS